MYAIIKTKKLFDIGGFIMNWSPSLETGVNKIDSQHKDIIEKMNDIRVACGNGTAADSLLKTLKFLENYVQEHFADEEKLQIESKYPKYNEHKQAHIEFIKKIDELMAQFEKEGASLPLIISTNNTIFDWFVKHINNVDKEFAQYYKNR